MVQAPQAIRCSAGTWSQSETFLIPLWQAVPASSASTAAAKDLFRAGIVTPWISLGATDPSSRARRERRRLRISCESGDHPIECAGSDAVRGQLAGLLFGTGAALVQIRAYPGKATGRDALADPRQLGASGGANLRDSHGDGELRPPILGRRRRGAEDGVDLPALTILLDVGDVVEELQDAEEAIEDPVEGARRFGLPRKPGDGGRSPAQQRQPAPQRPQHRLIEGRRSPRAADDFPGSRLDLLDDELPVVPPERMVRIEERRQS